MNERQYKILELLKQHGRLSVKRLSESLFVSEMTIRRDLAVMNNEGYIQRYNGGAMYNQNESLLPIADRKLLQSKEKMRLAQKVVPFIRPGMTIFIDCSSTCHYIIPLLVDFKDIRIITNSVYNLLLAAKHGIPCTVIGGEYQHNEMCTAGGMATRFLSELNMDIAFLSALGISDDGEITDRNEPLTSLRKLVLERSNQSVFLFSHKKQGRKYMYTLCKVEDADAVFLE